MKQAAGFNKSKRAFIKTGGRVFIRTGSVTEIFSRMWDTFTSNNGLAFTYHFMKPVIVPVHQNTV